MAEAAGLPDFGPDQAPDFGSGGAATATATADLPDFDSLPEFEPRSTWRKAGYAGVKALADFAASQAGGAKLLLEPGKPRPFTIHEAALAAPDYEYRPMDLLTGQPKETTLSPGEESEAQLRASLAQRAKELAQPAAKVQAGAKDIAQAAGELEQETPGNEAVSKATETVAGFLPYLAEAAIPVVGPGLAVGSGGLASYGDTFDQAYEAYTRQGLSHEEAKAKADLDATRAGIGTMELFMALPGSAKSAADSLLADRLKGMRPVIRAGVEALAESGQGGLVMGANSLMTRAQAKMTYEPDMTWKDALEAAAKDAVAGAAGTAIVHAPGMLGRVKEIRKENALDRIHTALQQEEQAAETEQQAPKLRGQEMLDEARRTPDLAAELKAALEKNQIEPAAIGEEVAATEEKDAGTQSVQPALSSGAEGNLPDFSPEVKETSELTPAAAGATTEMAAPETITGGTGGAETSETPRTDTPERTGSPTAIESGPIPAEGSATPANVQEATGSRSAVASRTRPISTEKRGWDIIDEVEGGIGTIDPTLIQEANPDWKPVGAARKIFRKGGTRADDAAKTLFESGHFKGDPNQVDQLGDALNQAALGRQGDRRTAAAENLQNSQDAAFQRDKGRPGPNQKPVVADELQVGDTLKVRGTQFRVKSFEFDEDGGVVGVTVEDGKKYGTQVLAGGEQLHVDKRSVRHSDQEVVTDRTSRGTQVTRLARPGEEGTIQEDPFLGWLDKAIDATDPLKGGQVLEGVTGAPVWLTKTLVNGALRVVRAAYQGGKRLAEAIEDGVAWLREQKAEGFKEDEARTWLTKAAKEANPVIERNPQQGLAGARPSGTGTATAEPSEMEKFERERDKRAEKLNEINKQAKRPGGLTDLQKSERHILRNEILFYQRQLLKNRDYVGKLLKRIDQLTTDGENARKAGNGANAKLLLDEARGLMDSELQLIEPALLKRVYDESVAKGELMPPTTTAPASGRTLGTLTAWLSAQKIESPRLGIRDRFRLAQRAADAWNRTKDSVAKAADRVQAAWEAFKGMYRQPPKDTEFRSLIKDWLFEKQWTGLETHRWLQAIREKVPSKSRRVALSIWLDAGGDEELLRQQAAQVPDRFKPWWQEALNLTEDEKSIARRIKLDFEQKMEDAQTVGLMERGREDYGVPQIWEVIPQAQAEYDPATGEKRTPRRPNAQLDPRDPFFALQRTHASYFDGIMAGGIPKSLDLADLVGVYNADFNNALADRSVIRALKDAKASEGTPIVMISGAAKVTPRAGDEPGMRTYFVDSNWRPKEAVTKDGRLYRTIDHWALRGWKFASVDAEGNPIIVHGDFLVHPDHYKFLKNELGQSWMRDPDGGAKYFKWILTSQGFLKASKFASATFHMATIGEHALFHAVMPTTGAVELDPLKNERLGRLMQNGLDLGFGQARELFEEGLASHGGVWGKVPGLGDLMTRMSDYLFKDYIPKIKTKVGMAVLERNFKRYQGKLTDQQVYELTASQVNAGFGIQNWRLLGTNKTMLDVNRLLLTAPDFLLSRFKVVGQAVKPYNREQLLFLAYQAAGVYIVSRALNALLNDGDAHWEPENALSVIYHGRKYSARFLVNDIAYAVTDPVGFASGRLGVIPRTAIETVTGRDMRTGARIEVPFKTNNKALHAAQVALKDVASWLVPVGAEGLLPGAKGKEETGPGQLALGLVGVGSRRYSAQNQVRDWATEFNRNSEDKTTRLQQERKDEQPIQEGPYRKLDALLRTGELEDAKREYQALLEEGYKPMGIREHYRVFLPYTGNRAREAAFVKSLTDRQKTIYDQARQERLELFRAFSKMAKPASSPTTAEATPAF